MVKQVSFPECKKYLATTTKKVCLKPLGAVCSHCPHLPHIPIWPRLWPHPAVSLVLSDTELSVWLIFRDILALYVFLCVCVEMLCMSSHVRAWKWVAVE